MSPDSSTRQRQWRIIQADCFDALPKLAANSADAIVTDPPYGIGANGLAWDRPARLDPDAVPGRRKPRPEFPNEPFQAFSRAWSEAALPILRPGGYLAAFAAARTVHRLTCGLEEAGYEIRDVCMWLQGQGYPATRVLPGGLGTGLKPAWEPIVLARRPLQDTLDATLAEHRTGAMNIDACRIALTAEDCPNEGRGHGRRITANPRGRWPANLLLSHGHDCREERCEADCPIRMLGDRHRFFYASKAPRRERDAGCEKLPRQVVQTFKIGVRNEQLCAEHPVANVHPTVKPLDLMRWLIRLLTPSGGLILDPFTGSGSTGAAAVLEGARFLGIEREALYIPIARARITHWAAAAKQQRRPAARARRDSGRQQHVRSIRRRG